MKSNRGFTLAELMIAIALAAIVIIPISIKACTGPETKHAATSEAVGFARDLGWKVKGISCTDIDSDRDGYVSCTIALENGTNEFVECRGAYSFGHGCRIPKLRIDRNAR